MNAAPFVTLSGRFFPSALAIIALWANAILADEPDRVIFAQKLPRIPALIVAPAKLADREALVFLDTGADWSMLDLVWKDSLRGEIGEAEVMGFGGVNQQMMIYSGPVLKLGRMAVQGPGVILSDMQEFRAYTGQPVSGLIGMKVIGRAKIFLSYDKRVFEIHDGPWRLDKLNSQEIELEKEASAPLCKMNILGHPATFVIDTGSDGCVELRADVFDALVKEGAIERAKVDSRALGLEGMKATGRGWFLKGEFMGKKLEGVSVDSNPAHSILGLEWLYGFNTEIDFSARKMRYELRRDAKLPGNLQMLLGAIFIFSEKGVRIERLRPGGKGAAEIAGLQAGDVIEQFGSLQAVGMNAVTLGEAVADAAGKEVSLRCRKANGQQVEIKLRVPSRISEWNFAGRDTFK